MNENFENSLSDEDSELQLQRLAIDIRQHPPLSDRRQLLLSILVNRICHSPNLARPQERLWSPDRYEDLYNEALQKTMLEICQKIDCYNPKYPVMAWINFHLKTQFTRTISDRYKKGVTYLPEAERRTFSPLSLDELERDVPSEEAIGKTRLLRQFLAEDPENRLQVEYIKGNRRVTFQFLALAKFVEDRTWTDIAADLEIPLQTLYSFFYRRLKELIPYFRKYLQE